MMLREVDFISRFERAVCIFFQLTKANHLGGKFMAQKAARLNITPVQAQVLRFLSKKDAIP